MHVLSEVATYALGYVIGLALVVTPYLCVQRRAAKRRRRENEKEPYALPVVDEEGWWR